MASLSPAQARILTYLRRGLLNKQIAFELGVTEATVKAHMTAAFKKLGFFNRTQALIMLPWMLLFGEFPGLTRDLLMRGTAISTKHGFGIFFATDEKSSFLHIIGII